MPSKLIEKRNELDAKRKALHDIFKEAGDDMDMAKVTSITGTNEEKARHIKTSNDELTALGKEVDELAELEEIAKSVKGEPGGSFTVPGSNQGGNGKGEETHSFGELFINSAAFKSYNRTTRKSEAVEIDLSVPQYKRLFGSPEMKAQLNTTGFAPEATRIPLVLPGALRPIVITDLIPEGQTSQNAIVYMEETTTTNGAAAVAEGASKPESALAFTEKSSSVKKIATVLPVTDELFEDVPAMQSYVEGRLRLFLDLAEESALLNGSGSGANLRGLLNTSGIQTRTKGADPIPDAMYKAVTDIYTGAFLRADGYVMNPEDWQDVRLLRTADGIYIWGSPADAGPERMWGLPVALSIALTSGTALVGAFKAATQKFRRNQVSFAVSDQHSDFFVTNQLMLRVEERLALVVYRPAGLETVDLTS